MMHKIRQTPPPAPLRSWLRHSSASTMRSKDKPRSLPSRDFQYDKSTSILDAPAFISFMISLAHQWFIDNWSQLSKYLRHITTIQQFTSMLSSGKRLFLTLPRWRPAMMTTSGTATRGSCRLWELSLSLPFLQIILNSNCESDITRQVCSNLRPFIPHIVDMGNLR